MGWNILYRDESALWPALGQHGIDYDIDGAGSSPMTVALGTTLAAGGSLIVCAAGEMTDIALPTDNKSNSYSLLRSSGYFGGLWPGFGLEVSADAQISGGAGHDVSVAKPGTPAAEGTMIAVEIVRGGVVQDSSIVARQTGGAGATLTSAAVTTTGPALLVSFWGGDGAASTTPMHASPGAGWTKIREVALESTFHIQMACAVRQVGDAGTYTCDWIPAGDQGGVIALIAVQKG